MEGGGKGESKKVMVVIDESDSSYYALMWVLNNLKELITSSSLLLFATQPPPSCNFALGAPFGSARLYFQGLAGQVPTLVASFPLCPVFVFQIYSCSSSFVVLLRDCVWLETIGGSQSLCLKKLKFLPRVPEVDNYCLI